MNSFSAIPPLAHEFVALDATQFPLANKFYQAQGYKVKCGRQERVFAVKTPSKEFIAAARLMPLESQNYWLRNLLVAPIYRQRGLGAALMQSLLKALAPGHCYCFALPEVEEFYRRLGFVNLTTIACPEDVKLLAQRYDLHSRDWRLMAYRPT
jgi:N-acetylglutamate synthase-like GNAT family acetyltransferase